MKSFAILVVSLFVFGIAVSTIFAVVAVLSIEAHL